MPRAWSAHPCTRRSPSRCGCRCGCPWWNSDEWDAKCIRCGWDCESTGYDDDSQPLPKYKKKWEGFVAQINAGKTPAWPQRGQA